MEKTKYVGVFIYSSQKRKDKCFYILYKSKGKNIKEKVGWSSEGYNAMMASQVRAERLRSIRHGDIIPEQLTIHKAIALYRKQFSHLKSTVEIEQYVNEIEGFFGEKRELSDITSSDVVDFIEFIKQKKSFKGTPLSAQSVVHRYSALRQLFNYCIGLNIYKGISPLNMRTKNALPKVDNKIINYLSEEEIRNFLGVLESYRDKNLANLFKFAFFTGMRLNEILSLEWQHFDSSKSILKITASKSGKIENIALSKQALHILEEQRHLIPSDVKYVFPNDEYKRRANVRTQFIKLKEQAGINRPFRFHDLRHNYASMLIESGVDLYTVQHLLTHKDPKTTQRYAHLKPDNMINAADKVGKLVEKLKKN